MSHTLEIEERIVKMLRTVYDPEIPVNVYDLGLIYKVDVDDDGRVGHRYDPHCSQLSGGRLHRRRCQAENRKCRGCLFGSNQSGF